MLFDLITSGVKKGAYLAVESWENDGDNYATKLQHYDSIQDAEFALEILRAQTPLMNECGSGSDIRDTEEWNNSLNNLKALIESGKFNNCSEFKELEEVINEALQGDGDGLCDVLCGINGELVGNSEWYFLRVLEKAIIVEVPEDVAFGQVVAKFTSR